MSYNFTKTQFEEELKKGNGSLLYKKIATDTLTPVLAGLKLFQKFPNYHFLFESAQNDKDGNNKKGRFSIIGLDPDLIWKCKDKNSFLNDKKETGHPLENLRALIKDSQINWSDLKYNNQTLPAMCGGLFGYFGYDIFRLIETIPDKNLPDEINIADSIFIRPQILVIFDNFFDCALICAPVFKGQNKNYDELSEKIFEIEKIIFSELKTENKEKKLDFNFTSNYSESEYCAAVEKAKKYIIDGDIFQVLPSQRFTSNYNSSLNEFDFYRSLRQVNPSPFLFYLKLDDFALSGSSPEIMVSSHNKKVTIRPLAGTRKRGKDKEEDKIIAAGLLKDEKEIAEHLMLIDLGRHDVGRVAKEGTVKLTEKMIIEYYSHVMHISSNVEGILRDDLESLDALLSGFPAGTVSGAPKIRAIEIIEEIEKVRRSFYAGCVGYFASNGDMETCITLRSALIKNHKIYLQSGAGVVFDSDPKSEYQECLNKARALMVACEKIS